jgi:hypothetical protein
LEGFEIAGVHYLPDFYLPRLNAYLEVKGHWDPTLTKARLLAEALGSDYGVYALVNGIPSDHQLARLGWWDAVGQTGVTGMAPWSDWSAWFPLGWDPVLTACEAARSARFDQPGAGVQPLFTTPRVSQCRQTQPLPPAPCAPKAGSAQTPVTMSHRPAAFSPPMI